MRCEEHGVQRSTCAGWKHYETAEGLEILRLRDRIQELEAHVKRLQGHVRSESSRLVQIDEKRNRYEAALREIANPSYPGQAADIIARRALRGGQDA